MKRWTFPIVLCLMLGVVTTVGVAWGLALLNSEDKMFSRKYRDLEGITAVRFHENGLPTHGTKVNVTYYFGCELVDIEHGVFFIMPPEEELEMVRELQGESELRDYIAKASIADGSAHDVLPWWCRGYLDFDDVPSDQTIDPVLLGYGIPCRSMYWDCRYKGWERDPKGALWWLDRSGELHALPLRPILPGFLFNTLFYAVIWFGLFFGIGAIHRGRKAIRRKRGRCEKCGYDLRGTPDDVEGCSECGWGRES